MNDFRLTRDVYTIARGMVSLISETARAQMHIFRRSECNEIQGRSVKLWHSFLTKGTLHYYLDIKDRSDIASHPRMASNQSIFWS